LVAVFEMIGRAPRILVFDNATGVGHRFGREVTMTRVFNAFRAHCRIGEVRFREPVFGSREGRRGDTRSGSRAVT
jgi:hypothetical protein